MNKNILKAVGLVSAGAAVGSTCTFFSVRGHFKKKYEAAADEEIKSVKKTYALLRKEGPYSNPATAAKAYKERVTELEYLSQDAQLEAEEERISEVIQEKADEQKEVLRNIFDESHADVLLTAMNENDNETLEQVLSMREAEKQDARDPDAYDELTSRDPNEPFHIPRDDFFDDSNEFEKLTLTYYEGDMVLTDDADKIIPNLDDLIGKANLNRFGHASDDPNIVFVRNERLRADFEVIRDTGDYTEVILGIKSDPAERAHRIRRMRSDDE